MLTLYFTIGLPASGKSTTARKMASESGGRIREVTKDELRTRPEAPKERGKQERWVIAQRDKAVIEALSTGHSIVVHDTNFNPIHRKRLESLAAEHGAKFEVLDFTHVDVHECIRRDALRPSPVGEKVIWEMWQRYLYQPPQSEPTAELADAVIVDIDGTLARMNGRKPYDFDRVGEDAPVPHIVELVKELAGNGTQIIYLSGREDSCRAATEEWLRCNVGVDGPLHMRAAGDHRPDSTVKHELYLAHIKGRVRPRFVLDDRDSVVHMWRTVARIPVLQVDYGRF